MRIFISIFSMLLLYSSVVSGHILVLLMFLHRQDSIVLAFASLCGGYICRMFVIRRWLFPLYVHEYTHALAAKLFFRKVYSVKVTPQGGQVFHSNGFGGTWGNDMIGLAPYWLPLLVLMVALLKTFFSDLSLAYFGLFGLVIGINGFLMITEAQQNWHKRTFRAVGSGESTMSDIGQRGFVYSFIIILSYATFIHLLLLIYSFGGSHAAFGFASDIASRVLHVVSRGVFSCVEVLSHIGKIAG